MSEFIMFQSVRLTVPLVGFSEVTVPKGTRGAIVEIYDEGAAYEIDVSNDHRDAGTVTAERGQIELIPQPLTSKSSSMMFDIVELWR